MAMDDKTFFERSRKRERTKKRTRSDTLICWTFFVVERLPLILKLRVVISVLKSNDKKQVLPFSPSRLVNKAQMNELWRRVRSFFLSNAFFSFFFSACMFVWQPRRKSKKTIIGQKL